jgi:hypothetical protein
MRPHTILIQKGGCNGIDQLSIDMPEDVKLRKLIATAIASAAAIAFAVTAWAAFRHYFHIESFSSLLRCAAERGPSGFACEQVIRLRIRDEQQVAALNDEAGALYPSMLADREQAEKYLDMFLRSGVRINAATSVPDRGTALHVAAATANAQAIALLLAHHADPMVRDRDGKLPLDRAREAKRVALERPADYRRAIELLEAAHPASAGR